MDSKTPKRIKPGRIMLRTAGKQYLDHHYGQWYRPDPELIEDDEDARHSHDEIEYLKRQQHYAPKLSDEFMDD